MGNFFSSNQNQFQELHHRLQNLEGLDANKDGLITKQEFENWKGRQREDLDMFRENIVKMKDQECQAKLVDLQKQIETLEEINQSLEIKLDQVIEQNEQLEQNPEQSNDPEKQKLTRAIDTKVFSEASKKKIHEVINRMIENDSVNIKYLPDFVERQLYKNVFNILLGLLSELIEGSSVGFLGHEITLAMNAQVEEEQKEEEKED